MELNRSPDTSTSTGGSEGESSGSSGKYHIGLRGSSEDSSGVEVANDLESSSERDLCKEG